MTLQRQVIRAAHDNGLVAVAHALSHDATIEILEAGADGMTHTFVDKLPEKRLIDAYKRNNA